MCTVQLKLSTFILDYKWNSTLTSDLQSTLILSCLTGGVTMLKFSPAYFHDTKLNRTHMTT